MTATLTIKAGIGIGTSFDLGTVINEDYFYNSGTTSIPISFQGSEGTFTYNVLGGTAIITLNCIKSDLTSSFLTNLRTFTQDLKLISDYQKNLIGWSIYTNDKSKIYDIGAGITVKFLDFRVTSNFRDPINYVIFTIRLTQTKAT